MKRKGFTLIELLAVIVVIAIIVTISFSMIGNAVEEARLGAFKDSVLIALDGAELSVFPVLIN